MYTKRFSLIFLILFSLMLISCGGGDDDSLPDGDDTQVDGDSDTDDTEVEAEDNDGDMDSSDGDVSENEVEQAVGFKYENCPYEFDPYDIPERQYTIAPYASNPKSDSVTLTWEALDDEMSFILWGKDGKLDTVSCVDTPSKITVDAEDFEETHDGWMFRVELDGLDAQSRYTFTIPKAQIPVPDSGDALMGHMNFEPFTDGEFASAPLPGESFTMMIVGDNQGLPSEHAKVTTHMEEHISDLMLHLGDIVHNGVISQYRGSYFLLSSHVLPRMASVHIAGNHEGHGPILPYDAFFLPEEQDNENRPQTRAFTYDYGHARFFVLDSEFEMGKDSLQLEWLDKQLERTVKEDTDIRYLFCAWHRPTYSISSSRHEGPMEAIDEVVKRWKVDVVWTGHDHCYQRFDQDGVLYIVTGGAGALLSGLNPDSALPGDNYITGDNSLHILTGEVGYNSAEFRAIRTKDKVEIDRFTVEAKDRSGLR